MRASVSASFHAPLSEGASATACSLSLLVCWDGLGMPPSSDSRWEGLWEASSDPLRLGFLASGLGRLARAAVRWEVPGVRCLGFIGTLYKGILSVRGGLRVLLPLLLLLLLVWEGRDLGVAAGICGGAWESLPFCWRPVIQAAGIHLWR